MDVNGTRFHLMKGRNDWRRCLEEHRDESGETKLLHAGDFKSLEFDTDAEDLRLKSSLVIFVSARGGAQPDPAERRGAAADAFQNWYWISNDRRKIFWRPLGSQKSRVFWSRKKVEPDCKPSGDFAPVAEVEAPPVELAGLVVTSHHYLVVGNLTEHGLFIFDLHAGGAPMLISFPTGVPFEPFDMAPAPRGGVWILDRANKTYWGLDRDFRVLSEGAQAFEIAPEDEEVFHVEGGTASVRPARHFALGFKLPPEVTEPVAIEGLSNGSVLILDSPAYQPGSGSPPSLVHNLLRATRADEPFELRDASVEIVDELNGVSSSGLSVVGYDFAFVPSGESAGRGTLHVVEREGNQCISFSLNLEASPNELKIITEFRPMHFFGGRALVAYGGETFYDVVSGDPTHDRAVRWTQSRTIDEPRYPQSGTLLAPTLDGRERGCVWHRLFLDACIPAESSIEVWTRAHDDPLLLEQVEWSPEPAPYLRAAGPELPYFDAFPWFTTNDALPENTGTWELLFQRARGRFCQLKLVLRGNGRTSPHLHALRAYYPRFSYPRNYLPAVYLDDAGSADFLERMLANQEGFYADIEGRINDVSLLFDPRGAPPEALDWLAGWVGIVLDPLWAGIQGARQQSATKFMTVRRKPFDRRRLFIRFARKLYDRRGTHDGILFALLLLLDPCLEVLLERLKRAAVRPEEKASASLLEELRLYGLLEQYGLPMTNGVRTRLRPSLTDEEFEDLLYDYVLSPKRPTKVRIVERYRTRGGRRLQEGDASALPDAVTVTNSESVAESIAEVDAMTVNEADVVAVNEAAAGADFGAVSGTNSKVAAANGSAQSRLAAEAPDAFAHQFSVLVPEELTPEEEAMTRRIAELEKPAHTSFDVRRYWDFFRAGVTRLGIDTVLGEESRFVEVILGRSYLAEGFLRPSHPADVTDRLIADRDRLGRLPSL